MRGWAAVGVLLRIIANETKKRERGAMAQSGDEMSMTEKFVLHSRCRDHAGVVELEVEPGQEKSRKPSPQRVFVHHVVNAPSCCF